MSLFLEGWDGGEDDSVLFTTRRKYIFLKRLISRFRGFKLFSVFFFNYSYRIAYGIIHVVIEVQKEESGYAKTRMGH